MKKHKWTVGTLQEMEPIGNTDMNSKTLGKNWNRGQVIELRLRTDSYDGWRAYDMVSFRGVETFGLGTNDVDDIGIEDGVSRAGTHGP